MLPNDTNVRVERESVRGKQSGRTLEIQRLIGRSLRSVIDFSLIPDKTIIVDRDVLQADGRTRTASITGAMVAPIDALNNPQRAEMIKKILLLVGQPQYL